MKRILYISLLFVACNGGLDSNHEVRYSADRKDCVTLVRYFDGRQFNNIYMNCDQFKTLYNEGGYEAVYEYALTHELPAYWKERYNQYK